MLNIQSLKVKIAEKEILCGVDLHVDKGKIHALMGQNGSGKSTLAQTIMGNPNYEISAGTVLLNGSSLLSLDPAKRAQAGLFLSFQYPSEIQGVVVSSYLRLIHNKKTGQNLSPVKFRELLKEKMALLDMKQDYLTRHLNEGFSGGEKKRMEMLQMLVLEPSMIILDEVDSGLDIDAVKLISAAVNHLHATTDASILIITHYTRILNYIKPDKVHIMQNGLIVKNGDMSLAHDLESYGYANLIG